MNKTKFASTSLGVLLCAGVAGLALLIEWLLPVDFIGASVIALFLGMLINSFLPVNKVKEGLDFSSKKLLKFAIILLGSSLTVSMILQVGQLSLIVMMFTLVTCFGGGYVVGKLLKLDWKLSSLISAGTGICGGSAIAALSPVIEAEDKQVAYALSATFIFDMVMIIIFPLLGQLLGLSDIAYGLWAGTAVNDTSSVVAAGYAYSEAGGNFATMVKMTRSLVIIPTVICFAFISVIVKRREERKAKILAPKPIVDSSAQPAKTEGVESEAIVALKEEQTVKSKINIMKIFPWFIVGFLLLAVVNSFGIIPASVSSVMKETSQILMVVALAGIGLKTSFRDMRASGVRPMLHGFIVSALVVIVAIIVIAVMGLL